MKFLTLFLALLTARLVAVQVYFVDPANDSVGTRVTALAGTEGYWTEVHQGVSGPSTATVQTVGGLGGNALNLNAGNGWESVGNTTCASLRDMAVSAVMQRGDQAWIWGRWDGNYSGFAPNTGYGVQWSSGNGITLFKHVGGSETSLSSTTFSFNSTSFTGKLVLVGTNQYVYCNGTLVISWNDTAIAGPGRLALESSFPGSSSWRYVAEDDLKPMVPPVVFLFQRSLPFYNDGLFLPR